MEREAVSAYSIEKGFFTTVNGANRYGRPLYGPPGLFHVYAGDRPEWALSRPGKTGNLLIGIVRGAKRKWLIHADTIRAKYLPGVHTHEIRDRLLGSGEVVIQSVGSPDMEALLVKISVTKGLSGAELVWAFGGLREIESCYQDFDTCGYTSESHFFPKPEDSEGNSIRLDGNTFVVTVPFVLGSPRQPGHRQYAESIYRKFYAGVTGAVTGRQKLRVVDADIFRDDMPIRKSSSNAPAVCGRCGPAADEDIYIGVAMMNKPEDRLDPASLGEKFAEAIRHHEKVRTRVSVSTPDEDLNAVVPALAGSMDAVWDPPYIVHGGIHCHSPYLGWRHCYGATAFGWWDRAESHFRTFAKTQLKETPPDCRRPRPDEEFGLARQDAYRSILHSKGQIWSHRDDPLTYNMQEVFVDMMLRHLLYTGDRDFLEEMFPVLELHLEWEKRCFDPDGDGLYENFANTHISDAHQYNGAGCAQASAYTYYANRMMSRLASMLGKDGRAFAAEAAKIKRAMNRLLWMPEHGAYAECRDLMGLRRRNESPELPSIYHPIDSELPDMFQAYQMISYAANTYEHVRCGRGRGYLVWSSNWTPWFWSTRQLMLNETCHLALAAWASGRNDRAYEYFIGSLLNSMLETRCPAGVIATSPLDKHNPGLATDFPCGTGIACRALIEGLFGIVPNALESKVLLRPGFPRQWRFARITTPYISYDYRKTSTGIRLQCRFPKDTALEIHLPYLFDALPEVTVNGRTVKAALAPAVGAPLLRIRTRPGRQFDCVIRHAGRPIAPVAYEKVVVGGEHVRADFKNAKLLEIRDPQGCVARIAKGRIIVKPAHGHHTFFAKLRQNDASWWRPFDVEIRPPVELLGGEYCKHENAVHVTVRDNTTGRQRHKVIRWKSPPAVPGTYTLCTKVRSRGETRLARTKVPVWNLPRRPDLCEFQTVDLSEQVNLDIADIFLQEYRTPRSPYCSLQLPITGYGEWCGGSKRQPPKLDSVYFCRRVDAQRRFITPQGVAFHSPNWKGPTAVMVSQWDNFPSKVAIPIPRIRADRLYFLVAGSVNPMYSQMDIARLVVTCSDGSVQTLGLHNPNNFWAIWGDPDLDADSFCLPETPPQRVLIGEGTWANLLDMELGNRIVTRVDFECLANETVVGLLGITAHPARPPRLR